MPLKRMSILERLLLVFLLSTNRWLLLPRVDAQQCALELWVYRNWTQCGEQLPPDAVAPLYADGNCHAATVNTSEISGDVASVGVDDINDLLPGNYRAVCTAEGMVRFLDSACSSATCAASTDVLSTSCARTNGTSSLYARLDIPEYTVQDIGEEYFSCLRLKGSDADSSVHFVVMGNCSQPDCQVMTGGTFAPTTTPDRSANTNSSGDDTLALVEPTLAPSKATPPPADTNPLAPAPQANAASTDETLALVEPTLAPSKATPPPPDTNPLAPAPRANAASTLSLDNPTRAPVTASSSSLDRRVPSIFFATLASALLITLADISH